MKRKSKGQLMVEKASKQPRVYSKELLTAVFEPDIMTDSQLSMENEVSHSTSSSDKDSALIAIFRCLEVVIYRLQSRDQIALWSIVKDNCQRLYSKNVTLDDLCLILLIYPGAYTVDWQGIRHKDAKIRDYQLTIQLPVNQASTSSSDMMIASGGINSPTTSTTTSSMTTISTKHHRHTSRMEMFISSLEMWLNHGYSLLPDHSILPPKPNIDALISNTASTIKTVAKDLQSRKIYEQIARKEELSQFHDGGLSGLRNLAVYREQREKQQASKISSYEHDHQYKHRCEALLRISYVLRALCLQQKRHIRIMDDFTSSHAEELGTTGEELRARLQLLAEECPEFLMIHSANDLVTVETLQVNIDCPMVLVQERIASLLAKLHIS